MLSVLGVTSFMVTDSASAAGGTATVRVCFYESGYVTGTKAFTGDNVLISNYLGVAIRPASGGCATVAVWAGVATQIRPQSLVLGGGTPWYTYAAGSYYDLGWVRVIRSGW